MGGALMGADGQQPEPEFARLAKEDGVPLADHAALAPVAMDGQGAAAAAALPSPTAAVAGKQSTAAALMADRQPGAARPLGSAPAGFVGLAEREQRLAPILAALEAQRRKLSSGSPARVAWARVMALPGARLSLGFLLLLGLVALLAPLWPLPSPLVMQLRAEPRPPVWPFVTAAADPGDGIVPLGLRPTRHLRQWANDGWAHRLVLTFELTEAYGGKLPEAAGPLAKWCAEIAGREPSLAAEADGDGTRLCLSLPLGEAEQNRSRAQDPAAAPTVGSAEARSRAPSPTTFVQRFEAANQAGQPLPELCAQLPGAPQLMAIEAQQGIWPLKAFDQWLLSCRARLFGLWQSGPWLGTDSKGRDLLARLVWGSRISLEVSLFAALCSLLIGVTYGAVAGYLGGRIDNAMMRLVDVLYSLPLIFLVIFLVSILNAYRDDLAALGIDRLTLFYGVLGAVSWLTMARVVRGQVLRQRRLDYVLAIEALGASRLRIITRHLLPNLLAIVVVYLTLTIPSVMLYEAFLSFLGLGVEPPQVSWGLLVQDGSESISRLHVFWWLLVFPAALMGLTLLALNLLGDALREALDPKLTPRGGL
jgi:ABC-type dipeptide/oligopeptide/nickel transport system permease subunit